LTLTSTKRLLSRSVYHQSQHQTGTGTCTNIFDEHARDGCW